MISWAGKNSDDVRVVVERYPAQPRPAKRLETVQIPGRNGYLVVDRGCYENYVQPYDVYISAEKPRLPAAARVAAAWLYEPAGYQRLEDSYDRDFYRMAYFSGPQDIENIMNRFGRARIEFICKPQRFLKAGEQPEIVQRPMVLNSPWAFAALPLIKVYGTGPGTLTVGDRLVQIKALDGWVMLDSDTQNAYKDTLNKNGTIYAPEFPQLAPGDNLIAWTGGVTHIEITPRWWTI